MYSYLYRKVPLEVCKRGFLDSQQRCGGIIIIISLYIYLILYNYTLADRAEKTQTMRTSFSVAGAYFAAAVISSVLWGLFPVFGRYIQTQEEGHPSSVSLIFVVCVVDTALIGAYILAQRRWSVPAQVLLPPPSSSRKLTVALVYGLLCLSRMLSNMQSTRMTTALNVQMTAMLVPFVTAAAARIVLGELVDSALPFTLLFTLGGCLLILAGQGAFSIDSASRRVGLMDVAGIGMQLISILFSAAIKIYWRTSEGILGKDELLIAQFAVGAVPTGCYSVLYDRTSLAAIAQMDAVGWLLFAFLAVGVYILGNLLQIIATRGIGAANATATHSVRLVAASAAGWLLLGEPITTGLEWAGIAAIVGTLTTYYIVQARRQRVAAQHGLVADPSRRDAVVGGRVGSDASVKSDRALRCAEEQVALTLTGDTGGPRGHRRRPRACA